jgi:hypothetical protein
MRRIAFIGCRDWDQWGAVRDEMLATAKRVGEGFVVITGDASG